MIGDELTLTSDVEIRWNPGAERRYSLFRRNSHPQEVLAIGLPRDLKYFDRHAKDDPELMLLIVSKKRIGPNDQNSSADLKKRLMREAWRPEFYKSESLPLKTPK